MPELRLKITGVPVPQGRPRVRVVPGKGARKAFATVYDPKESRAWKEEVARQAVEQLGARKFLEGALKMSLVFWMPRPKSLPKKAYWHIKKPDSDNLAKSIKDALEGICYKGDQQVCCLRVNKQYIGGALEPCVTVRIEEIG